MFDVNSTDYTKTAATFITPDKSILKGCVFLKQQLHSGRWGLSGQGADGGQNFTNDKGHLFTGFFIAQALDSDLEETDRALLLMRLISEEVNGRWGYTSRGYAPGPEDDPHFVDSDDTAFALRTFRQLGVYREPSSLMHFFRRQRRWRWPGTGGETGFVTFATTSKPVLVSKAHHAANFNLHPEVNANVFLALLDSNKQDLIDPELIIRSQSPDGSWDSYFYPSQYYGTFHFMELIRRLGGLKEQSDACLNFLKTTQNIDGSWGVPGNAYETALAIRACMGHATHADLISRGREFLLATQSENGSWHSDNVIWEFHKNETDIWNSTDIHNVITTSLCVSALRF